MKTKKFLAYAVLVIMYALFAYVTYLNLFDVDVLKSAIGAMWPVCGFITGVTIGVTVFGPIVYAICILIDDE